MLNTRLIANFKALWPFFLFYFILVLLVQNNSFFWDKDIAYSRLSQGILEYGPSYIFQNHVDMGYFPGLAFILSFGWKIFGVTLPVMHWIMFPVTIGLVYEVFRFSRQYIKKPYVLLALVIIMVDPALMSQSIMYSTDLFQVYLFFAGLNAFISNRRWLLSIILIALVLVHGRGTLTVATLFFSELVYRIIDKKLTKKGWFKDLLNFSWAYLPSVIVTLTYLLIHYQKVGWIGYHAESPWAGCYIMVDEKGIIRNIIITIWRMLDFGRFIVFMLILWGVFILLRRKEKLLNKDSIKIILPGILFFVLSLPSMLLFQNLIAQRYLLIFFALMALFAAYIIFERMQFSIRIKQTIGIVAILCLAGGNFWVYPDHIAQDWSSTLGHLPFYKQRLQMIDFIEENDIPFEEIGTATPNRAEFSTLYLSNNASSFETWDLSKDKYIYYSNIINDFSDEEIAELKREWIVLKEIKRLGIRTTLYKRP